MGTNKKVLVPHGILGTLYIMLNKYKNIHNYSFKEVLNEKIELDLDGVVFDLENLYRVHTEIYDTNNNKKRYNYR